MKTITEHFLIYQFAYIYFFISLIFIICVIFIKNKNLKLLFMTLFAVFIAMGLSESILILKNPNVPEDSLNYPPVDLLFVREKVVNHYREINVADNEGKQKVCRNRAPAAGETVIYDNIYGTYPNEFRYTKGNLTSNENYVFLGCSMVFGAGLNDNQTLPYYFSKIMNFEKNVLNCGIRGASINSAVSILESDVIDQFVAKNSHTKYIVYYMIPDHIYRNFRFFGGPSDNWRYKNNKWERVNLPFGIFNCIIEKSRFFISIYHGVLYIYGRNYSENYMIKSLEQMRELANNKYKAKFIVIVWQDFKKIPLFIDKLKKIKLDMIFLPEYFNTAEYKIKNDGHPSAKSNEELAQILMNHINRKDNKN